MPDPRAFLQNVWRGRGTRARVTRALLIPLEALYRVAVGARGALYDAGVFSAEEFSVPVLSVGNLTVGGTGKTPVSAWFASQLIERGITPGVVLRGYGGDETLVHERLNPRIPVVVASNRSRGIRAAIAEGAAAVVLDDAFQHRRADRDADIVLINADAWTGSVRLLPAGPWREPLRAARRANLIIITRKTSSTAAVLDLRVTLEKALPGIPLATVHLTPGELHSTSTGQTLPLHAVEGADITAVAAIAHPEAFFKQLTEIGAIVRPHSFADHHAFTRTEALHLAEVARESDFVVCTLKDAVKLDALWPAEAGSLWYVSQRLRVEDGRQHIDRLIDDIAARAR
ncbi:MAG TPA: tetraacyldisaccharide 4'-kinase [Gemmatimonadaceae bacterium]|nr:tetraacyldisaccharide 4'-kinase [Gemmatimonadaceae bacterium]